MVMVGEARGQLEGMCWWNGFQQELASVDSCCQNLIR